MMTYVKLFEQFTETCPLFHLRKIAKGIISDPLGFIENSTMSWDGYKIENMPDHSGRTSTVVYKDNKLIGKIEININYEDNRIDVLYCFDDANESKVYGTIDFLKCQDVK